MAKTLLTPAKSNPKTAKKGENFEAVVLHLAPATVACAGNYGNVTVCPWSTPGCEASCLNTSGRGQIRGALSGSGGDTSGESRKRRLRRMLRHHVHAARIRRTRWFFSDRKGFLRKLDAELTNLERRANHKGKQAVARLNCTSDIAWERVKLDGTSIIERHPNVEFYDYTKGYTRMCAFLAGELPANYHLTFSRTERSGNRELRDILRMGGNVAVLFEGEFPKTFLNRKVIDGVAHDFRFTDPPKTIVGLIPRGRARTDRSGFVVRLQRARRKVA